MTRLKEIPRLNHSCKERSLQKNGQHFLDMVEALFQSIKLKRDRSKTVFKNLLRLQRQVYLQYKSTN